MLVRKSDAELGELSLDQVSEKENRTAPDNQRSVDKAESDNQRTVDRNNPELDAAGCLLEAPEQV